MNDGCNEDKHKRNPWFSAQFHPEACSGPTDTEFMFDKFIEVLNNGGHLEFNGLSKICV